MKSEAMNLPAPCRTTKIRSAPSISKKASEAKKTVEQSKQFAMRTNCTTTQAPPPADKATVSPNIWVKPGVRQPLSEDTPGAPRNWPVRQEPVARTPLTTPAEPPWPRDLKEAFRQAFPQGKPAEDSMHIEGVLEILPALQPLLASLKEDHFPKTHQNQTQRE